MQIVIQFDKTDTITRSGFSEDRFYAWAELMTTIINELQPIYGSGSPEGVVTANEKQVYVDTNTPGTGIYYKTGSGNTGWIARS
jgi:hypothetical protein